MVLKSFLSYIFIITKIRSLKKIPFDLGGFEPVSFIANMLDALTNDLRNGPVPRL